MLCVSKDRVAVDLIFAEIELELISCVASLADFESIGDRGQAGVLV
jgi:hypothetical protein